MGRIVFGNGAQPAELMFIGEAPGFNEMQEGIPFCGKSGDELNRFLDGYILPQRPDVYVTNVYKERPPDNRDPTDEEIETYAPLLLEELHDTKPRIVACLGRFAARFMLGRDVEMDTEHGLAYAIEEPIRTIVFIAYHPAAGFRSPTMMSRYVYDMHRLQQLWMGTLPLHPGDQYPDPIYYEVTGPERLIPFEPIGIDTEGSKRRPWCLSYSQQPGVGGVVRTASCMEFARELHASLPPVILHNALHDLPVLRSMGVDLLEWGVPITDTMVMAYLLGLEPQGLKALGYRVAGMRMRDYMDLTREASVKIATEWLTQLVTQEIPRFPGPKPNDIEKACRLIERMLKKHDAKKPLRDRWADCRAREILQDDFEIVGEMPEPTLDDVPLDEAIQYAACDADATKRVAPYLKAQIEARGLEGPLAADLAVIPMIGRMQEVGIKVDLPYMKSLSKELGEEYLLNVEAIHQMAGWEVNPSSGDQVAEWLFGQLKLPWKKKTKSGSRPETSKKLLETLSKDTKIPLEKRRAVDLILDGRQIVKLKGTYADKIEEFLEQNDQGEWILYPNILTTRTDTGRLAAKEPNLLAFPKHGKRHKKIRHGFVARDGHLFGEWDVDQLEMRTLAIDADDDAMLEEFASGLDKHTLTAANMIYHLPFEMIDNHQRFTAKAVNFGILMGMTEFGLTDQINKNGNTEWMRSDSRAALDAWHTGYPKSSAYLRGKQEFAIRHGYVRDMWDRIRYLEGVNAEDEFTRSEALRQAQATPIQSGGQGIVKRWMAVVDRKLADLRKRGVWVECLLQIHDALWVEYDAHAHDDVDRAMHSALWEVQQPWHFPIPISCKGDVGLRWSEL
jgi:uracil-DNA glycosylase family 4